MKRNYLSITLFRLFTIQILFFCSQGIVFSQKTEIITLKDLRQHMDSIASDATEGRFTGSTGYIKAAQYVTNVFREAGLNPGCTNGNGEKTYFQPVPFIRNNYGSATSLTIWKNGKNKTFGHAASNFIILNPGIQFKNIPMASPVFIGYGIHEPEYGWDDYAGLDVKGKWVILLNGIPPDDTINPVFPDNLRKQYADWDNCETLKYNSLIKHKAAGVIVLPNKYTIENWESTVLRNYRFNYIHYAEADTNKKVTPERILPYILIQAELAQLLLTGQNYDPMANKGSYHSYILDNTEIGVAIDCKKEFIHCYNVVAIVPGTDSALRNEYVTVGAHLDHLGKIGNRVYNGANDDASGCVIILEAAKAIALNPPKRPVLFVLFTGEELNLIGSTHFVKHPPIPVEHILLNINIEQVGSKNRTFPGIWAIGSPQFKRAFYESGNFFIGTELKYDSIDAMVDVISSCDTYSFYSKKIPSIILGSGGFSEHHTTQDKIDLIDFEHLYKAAKLLHSFIMELGNK